MRKTLRKHMEFKMNATAMQIVNGFLFGVGMILAAALMKTVLHLSLMG